MIGEILLQDEIDRKTLEALSRIVTESEQAILTTREARIAIRSVFESVQGLLSEGVSEILNTAMSEFAEKKAKPMFPMHLKLVDGCVLYVCVDLDAKTLTLLNVTTNKVIGDVEFDSQQSVVKKAAEFVVRQIRKGATKL
jgi:pyruvoyl-dependent arginine decarboxylase (PvlArgDC)